MLAAGKFRYLHYADGPALTQTYWAQSTDRPAFKQGTK